MSIDIEEIWPLMIAEEQAAVAIVADRVFPNRIPQREALPAVIFRRISGGPVRTSNGKAEVGKAVFQVESWSATSQQEAREINKAVQGVDGNRAAFGDWWVQAVLINPDADQDNPQIPIHADDLGLFASFTEFIVFFKPRS